MKDNFFLNYNGTTRVYTVNAVVESNSFEEKTFGRERTTRGKPLKSGKIFRGRFGKFFFKESMPRASILLFLPRASKLRTGRVFPFFRKTNYLPGSNGSVSLV